jgi:Na+/H+-dicarboxylate symporter
MSYCEVAVPDGARDLGFLNQRQHAGVSLAFTETAGLKASAQITNGGLLSIAALVSTVLLSTAVLVHVATRDAHTKRLW